MGRFRRSHMAAAAGFAYRFIALPVGGCWLVTYKAAEQGSAAVLFDDHSKYGYSRLTTGYIAGVAAAAVYIAGRENYSKPTVELPKVALSASSGPMELFRTVKSQYPPKLFKYYGVNFFSSALVAGMGCSLALKYVIGGPPAKAAKSS